ncbi:MAG: hypothetical protein AB7P04_03220 [Bacteriovoracia bacterium]
MTSFSLKSAFIWALMLQTSATAFGHGEDKYGPNGGYIRMPGAFHTELVQASDQTFKVYLLDIHWQNPTIKNSSLDATIQLKGETAAASCKPSDTHFVCSLPKGKSLSSAKEVSLIARRDGAVGGPAKYAFPLKLVTH